MIVQGPVEQYQGALATVDSEIQRHNRYLSQFSRQRSTLQRTIAEYEQKIRQKPDLEGEELEEVKGYEMGLPELKSDLRMLQEKYREIMECLSCLQNQKSSLEGRVT